jgi:hypothetical protein
MRLVTRALIVLLIAAAAIALTADAAAAGGSGMQFDRAEYLPGDTGRASGTISVTDIPEAGWLEDGPFYGWIIEQGRHRALIDAGWTWPSVPTEAVRLGEVVAEPAATACCTRSFTLAFSAPDLPRGRYDLLICNDPCTKSLGDFTGGGLAINAPGAPSLAPAVAPDAAAAAAAEVTPPASSVPSSEAVAIAGTGTAARAPTGNDGVPTWVWASLAALALGTVGFVVWHGRARHHRATAAT